MATENVDLEFTAGRHRRDRRRSPPRSTRSVENIGARRLQTIMERVLDEISFNATDRSGEKLVIDGAYVRDRVEDLAKTPT